MQEKIGQVKSAWVGQTPNEIIQSEANPKHRSKGRLTGMKKIIGKVHRSVK